MNKFEELYRVSEEIIAYYSELYSGITLLDSSYDSRDSDKKKIITKLKELVLQENKIVSSFGRDDIDDCLSEIKEILEKNFIVESKDDLNTIEGIGDFLNDKILEDEFEARDYSFEGINRLLLVLENRSYVLRGQGRKIKIQIDGKDVYYETSIFDAFISYLYIEAYQKVKEKLNKLIPQSKEHFDIIAKLKESYESCMFVETKNFFASEIKTLVAGNDIDNINVPDVGRLIMIYRKFDGFNEFLYAKISNIIDRLSIITKTIITLEDKTEANITLNMYPILELVTLLEIIINNGDLEILRHIEFSCKEILDVNCKSPMISGIYDFAKKKIKIKENGNFNQ